MQYACMRADHPAAIRGAAVRLSDPAVSQATRMGIDYHFTCTTCRQYGGYFSQQAWGWGNMDIVESHAFLCNHLASCGQDAIRVLSEHDVHRLDLQHVARFPDEDGADEAPANYERPTFPHTDEWTNFRELRRRHWGSEGG